MRIGKLKLMEYRVINGTENLGPLLERWILFRHPKFFGVFLHKLCRSDHDRALHDHPWTFISLILKNGYDEIARVQTGIEKPGLETVEKLLRHKAGSILFRPAEWRHRVIIRDQNRPAWTLIFMGPRRRRWGFWTKTGWCWWAKYNPFKAICEEDQIWDADGDE